MPATAWPGGGSTASTTRPTSLGSTDVEPTARSHLCGFAPPPGPQPRPPPKHGAPAPRPAVGRARLTRTEAPGRAAGRLRPVQMVRGDRVPRSCAVPLAAAERALLDERRTLTREEALAVA